MSHRLSAVQSILPITQMPSLFTPVLFRVACLFLATPLAGSAAVFGNFTYVDNGSSITITQHNYWLSPPDVVIPPTIAGKPVTEIGTEVFRHNGIMRTISIPATVTAIGLRAFERCLALETVTLPPGISAIEAGTFSGCSELTAISFPSSVVRISAGAFENCSKLRAIDIPLGVRVLETNTFLNCSGLETVALPTGLTALGSNVFSGCGNLKTVALPSSLITIGDRAFQASGLSSIILPGTVMSLGDFAFFACNRLENVRFEGGLDAIGTGTFYGCMKLERIDLPRGLQRIGESAFASTGIKKIDLEAVREIGVRAFSNCQRLTRVVFPKSVQAIGEGAFLRCYQVAVGIFEGNAPTIGRNAFARGGDFKLIVSENSKGFTVPRWNGYNISLPTEEITILNSDGFEIMKDTTVFKYLPTRVGATSPVTAVYTVHNVGNRKLNDLSATISSGNSGDFSIKSPIRKSLAPGQSTKVQITFKPQNSGRRSSALFIRSTDSDEPFFRIVFSGVGITELN